MKESCQRILAMLLRYLYLHKRSLPRFLELVFWPVMELLVWGFVTLYIKSMVQDPLGTAVMFLINAMIFWDILYRSQQAVSISFMEEIWHQNILNILISPLRIWEWVLATFLYGLLKTATITLILSFLAYVFYHFNLIDGLGFALIPLAFNLLLFGWIIGIMTAGLLLRWGYAVEALIWGIPFLLQPLSAIFYPLSVLPEWLQVVSRCLPSTYVFEGMRAVLRGETVAWSLYATSLGLNLVFFVIAVKVFHWLFAKAQASGRLVRLGMD